MRYGRSVEFSEAMAALEALEQFEVVEAMIFGLGDAAFEVASLSGTLRRVQDPEAAVIEAADVADAEFAVCFQLGGGDLSFWPSRFVSAAPHDVGNGLTVTTLDGRVDVFSNRPWID